MNNGNTPKLKPSRRRAKCAASPNPPTKRARLIRLLSAGTGRDIASISKTLGWQAHSTRAALSGLRKAGYELGVEKAARNKPARYRITASPPEVCPTVPEVPR